MPSGLLTPLEIGTPYIWLEDPIRLLPFSLGLLPGDRLRPGLESAHRSRLRGYSHSQSLSPVFVMSRHSLQSLHGLAARLNDLGRTMVSSDRNFTSAVSAADTPSACPRFPAVRTRHSVAVLEHFAFSWNFQGFPTGQE